MARLKRFGQTAWKINVRLVGWIPAIGSAVTVAFGLVMVNFFMHSTNSQSLTIRVVGTVVPLVAGLQAAFLLSPDDEAPLELLLSCPRSLGWTLLERLVIMMILLGGVALVGNLAILILLDFEGLLTLILRWFAPCLCLSGTALFTTQLTRQGSFGALLGTLMWGGMLFGGDALLTRWEFLWPLHVYLQPNHVSSTRYLLNRGTLTLIGVILVALAIYLSNDEERMLIGESQARKVMG